MWGLQTVKMWNIPVCSHLFLNSAVSSAEICFFHLQLLTRREPFTCYVCTVHSAWNQWPPLVFSLWKCFVGRFLWVGKVTLKPCSPSPEMSEIYFFWGILSHWGGEVHCHCHRLFRALNSCLEMCLMRWSERPFCVERISSCPFLPCRWPSRPWLGSWSSWRERTRKCPSALMK